jgi:hypothetical protein
MNVLEGRVAPRVNQPWQAPDSAAYGFRETPFLPLD